MSRKINIIAVVILFSILTVWLIIEASNAPVGDAAKAVRHLQTLGCNVDENPSDHVQLDIPLEFDDVYEKYNDLQKQAGYNLWYYRGRRCERYTFAIINAEQADTFANVIIYKGKIIGGDIMTAALDGVMSPLRAR